MHVLLLSHHLHSSSAPPPPEENAAVLCVEGVNKAHLVRDLKSYKVPQRPFDWHSFRKKAFGKRGVKKTLCLRRKRYCTEQKKMKVKMVKTRFGRGLIARCQISQGELVVCYGGLKITSSENLGTAAGRKRAGVTDMSYLLRLENGEYRQGGIPEDIARGRLGSMANDPYGSNREPNVFFAEDPDDPKAGGEAFLVSMRSIEKGEEILVDYGWTPRTWKRILHKEDTGTLAEEPEAEEFSSSSAVRTQRKLFANN